MSLNNYGRKKKQNDKMFSHSSFLPRRLSFVISRGHKINTNMLRNARNEYKASDAGDKEEIKRGNYADRHLTSFKFHRLWAQIKLSTLLQDNSPAENCKSYEMYYFYFFSSKASVKLSDLTF